LIIGTPQLLALTGKEPVCIRRLRCPHRTAQESDELEQRSPVVGHRAVHTTSADRREQVLVDQFLLEVLMIPGGRQTPRSVQRPDHRESHDLSRSQKPTADREYRRLFNNPDKQSSIHTTSACRTWPHQSGPENQPVPGELRGVPVGLADLDDPDL
jgi:hypothetical protein